MGVADEKDRKLPPCAASDDADANIDIEKGADYHDAMMNRVKMEQEKALELDKEPKGGETAGSTSVNNNEGVMIDESGTSFASLEDELIKAREKEAVNQVKESTPLTSIPTGVNVVNEEEKQKQKQKKPPNSPKRESNPSTLSQPQTRHNLQKQPSLVVATPVHDSLEMPLATVMGDASNNESNSHLALSIHDESKEKITLTSRRKYYIWGATLLLIIIGVVVAVVMVTSNSNSSNGNPNNNGDLTQVPTTTSQNNLEPNSPTVPTTQPPTMLESTAPSGPPVPDTQNPTNAPSSPTQPPSSAPLTTIAEFISTAEEPDALPATFLLLKASGLLDDLSDLSRNFTVFAIHGSAIISAEATTFTQQLFRKEWYYHARSLLLAHIVEGPPIYLEDFAGQTVVTLGGQRLTLTSDPEPMVENATFQFANVQQLNGVVHAVRTILCPLWCSRTVLQTIAEFPSTQNHALALFNDTNLSDWGDILCDQQGPFTIFVPTDEAFEAFYAERGITELEPLRKMELLRYLVVPENFAVKYQYLLQHEEQEPNYVVLRTDGGDQIDVDFRNPNQTVINQGQANVVDADILASNGYIQVIDRVIVPPGFV